ncbi:hypothetical protein ACU4GD_45165 [Cupriavidus basilensis]
MSSTQYRRAGAGATHHARVFALPATLGLGTRHIAWEHCHFGEDPAAERHAGSPAARPRAIAKPSWC